MKLYFRGLFTCALLFAGVLLTGCSSPTTTGSPSAGNSPAADVARFRVGETVIVTFSGVPNPLDQHQEIIKEDGTITLTYIGAVHAAGKTAGELQREIHEDYVPEYFTHLTVTVSAKAEDRVVYVAGEVHNPNRVAYLSHMTVTKAIQAAGGLTDFANHGKVWLTHTGRDQRIQVDYDKAVKDPAADPPVYPDDQITVDKSW